MTERGLESGENPLKSPKIGFGDFAWKVGATKHLRRGHMGDGAKMFSREGGLKLIFWVDEPCRVSLAMVQSHSGKKTLIERLQHSTHN